MRYKFNSPTYADYSFVDSQISTCVQTSQVSSTTGDICDAILWCIINNLDNGTSAQYAAAATILGFIPTILSMVGTSRDDHLKIHKRFPALALLLSCCNPSTMIAGLAWRTGNPPEDVLLRNNVRLDAYKGGKYMALIIHCAAAAAAGLVIWQALVLGMRGVVSFACPTWYNPLIWLLVGPLAHIIDVIISRWCIEGRDRWRWNLSALKEVRIRWSWVMRLKDMGLTVLALADYIYGTVILSSMQLIAPRPALQIAVLFAVPAIFARLISILLLELGPNDHQTSARRVTDALSIPLVPRDFDGRDSVENVAKGERLAS